MAYWAIKRESKPLTTGIKRNSDRFEGWAVNLTLENKIVDVGIEAWDVRTSEVLYDQILLRDFTLPPNRSTEFPDSGFPNWESFKAPLWWHLTLRRRALW